MAETNTESVSDKGPGTKAVTLDSPSTPTQIGEILNTEAVRPNPIFVPDKAKHSESNESSNTPQLRSAPGQTEFSFSDLEKVQREARERTRLENLRRTLEAKELELRLKEQEIAEREAQLIEVSLPKANKPEEEVSFQGENKSIRKGKKCLTNLKYYLTWLTTIKVPEDQIYDFLDQFNNILKYLNEDELKTHEKIIFKILLEKVPRRYGLTFEEYTLSNYTFSLFRLRKLLLKYSGIIDTMVNSKEPTRQIPNHGFRQPHQERKNNRARAIKVGRVGEKARDITMMIYDPVSKQYQKIQGLIDIGADMNVAPAHVTSPFQIKEQKPRVIKEFQMFDGKRHPDDRVNIYRVHAKKLEDLDTQHFQNLEKLPSDHHIPQSLFPTSSTSSQMSLMIPESVKGISISKKKKIQSILWLRMSALNQPLLIFKKIDLEEVMLRNLPSWGIRQNNARMSELHPREVTLTPGHSILYSDGYHLTREEEDFLEHKFAAMENAGIVKRQKTRVWGHPVFVVPKKMQTPADWIDYSNQQREEWKQKNILNRYRVVANMIKLNKITVPTSLQLGKGYRGLLEAIVESSQRHLSTYEPKDPILLFTDSSSDTWSLAVFQNKQPNITNDVRSLQPRPLICLSGSFTTSEVKWHIASKELYPIIYSFERLGFPLRTHEGGIYVNTDHHALLSVIRTTENEKRVHWNRMYQWPLNVEEVVNMSNNIRDELVRLQDQVFDNVKLQRDRESSRRNKNRGPMLQHSTGNYVLISEHETLNAAKEFV
eukprot:augustus_masked-scaffold_2-processed-gene-17.42-mRNA-1 protein AED:1.00 eAED:1.00 QI:0/0/0/0/1/1/5/0/767